MAHKTENLHIKSTWKTKFCSHKQYLFNLLLPRNAKNSCRPKHTTVFLTVWKETSHKPLKVAAAKKSVPSDTTVPLIQLWWSKCFLLHELWDIIFYTNISLPRGLVQPPCSCVLWSKCFERSLHFICVIPTITSQCHWYQRSKIKLLLPKCSS